MRLVLHPHLGIRQVLAPLPVVAYAQVPLEGRGVGERAALVAVYVGDRSRKNPLPGGLVLFIEIRDRLAKARAPLEIADQRRRILQLAAVPGGRAVDRESAPYIGGDLQLHAPHLIVRSVGVVGQVAEAALRAEEADL